MSAFSITDGLGAVALYRVLSVLPPAPAPDSRRASVSSIIDEVAARHGVGRKVILGDDRMASTVRARQEAMYLAAHRTTLSMTAIARIFHRDHTTVLHGIRAHAARNGLPIERGGKWPKRVRGGGR